MMYHLLTNSSTPMLQRPITLPFLFKPKRVRQTIYRKPWMTAALLKSSRNKNKLYLAFINNPTPANKNKYTAYKNRFKSLCKKSEKTFYSAEFTRYSKDLKNTWITIKSIFKTKQHDSLIKCVNSNGSKITDNAHMAELFNNYFTNIADEVVTKIPSPSKPATFYLDPPSLTSFAIYPTSAEEVLALSTTLKTTQSTGPDDLNPSVMKPLLSIIAKPLAEIINCSLTTGIVPGPMKIAKVTPIYKQGNSEEVTNYRPISILPYFSKLLEKVMYVRLYNYIVTKGILYESQHGFQHGHSTLMSLLSVHDTIAAAIDRKEYAIGIFLDVAKAFDSVNHDILLLKLENLGIRGVTLAWFRSYLTGRYQQVKCNNHLSSLNLVKHGVPQGSILGPLLFLLFVNDLPNASSALHFYLFADDTNIFASNKSYEKLVQQLNLELVHVNDWFAANKLSLNIKKTNYILFSSHRKKLPLTEIPLLINNTPVPRVTSIKFLGVLIDSHLTWNDHIHSISKKIAKSLGILSRVAYLLPLNIRKNLYYTMIYPYLNYCNIIWASNYPSRLKRLTILQNRAVRFIIGYPSLCRVDFAYKQLGLLKLKLITLYQISEFMFKYSRNQLPPVFNKYFVLSTASAFFILLVI